MVLLFPWVDSIFTSSSSNDSSFVFNVLGSLYFLFAPLLSPVSFLFSNNLNISPIKCYLVFSYLLLCGLIPSRLQYCFTYVRSFLYSNRIKSIFPPTLVLMILCASIGYRADEITRQLLTIIIPLTYSLSYRQSGSVELN